MADDFLKATAHVGRQVLEQGGAEALRKAATDQDGVLSTEAYGQGTWRLLWRIRKFAQPNGQGLDALDTSKALGEATEHARIFLQRNPVVLGDEISERMYDLASAADSLDPDKLLSVVGKLS